MHAAPAGAQEIAGSPRKPHFLLANPNPGSETAAVGGASFGTPTARLQPCPARPARVMALDTLGRPPPPPPPTGPLLYVRPVPRGGPLAAGLPERNHFFFFRLFVVEYLDKWTHLAEPWLDSLRVVQYCAQCLKFGFGVLIVYHLSRVMAGRGN